MKLSPILARVAGAIDTAISVVSPAWGAKRMRQRQVYQQSYEAAKIGDSVWGNLRGAQGSADALLQGSLSLLRDRSRHAFRNYANARAAVHGLTSLKIGTGIDLEPNTGDDDADTKLKEIWDLHAIDCDIAGQLSLFDLQRQDARMETIAGCSLWYLVYDNVYSLIPVRIFALHPAQLSLVPVDRIGTGNEFRNGVEVDRYGRPQYYHITDNPGDYILAYSPEQAIDGMGISGIRTTPLRMRIKADLILHSYEKLEPGQSTGEPELSSVLSTLHDDRELVGAELTSAKVGAAPAVMITSPSNDTGIDMGNDATDGNGNTYFNGEAGMVFRGLPGEDLKTVKNERPSQQIMPFRTGLKGDVAAALRIPSRMLDRDPSRASFSSIRADNVDQERLLHPEAERYGRQKVGAYYQRILPMLAARAGVVIPKDPVGRAKFMRYNLIHDGTPYVNPLEDVQAADLAVRRGFSTYEHEIGRRGGNARQLHAKWLSEQKSPAVEALNKLPPPPKSAKTPGIKPDAAAPAVTADADQATGEVPAAGAESVQQTAMNGAQVTSLAEVVEAVAAGRLPAVAAKELVKIAFPYVNVDDLDAMIAAADEFEPTAPAAPPAATAPTAPTEAAV